MYIKLLTFLLPYLLGAAAVIAGYYWVGHRFTVAQQERDKKVLVVLQGKYDADEAALKNGTAVFLSITKTLNERRDALAALALEGRQAVAAANAAQYAANQSRRVWDRKNKVILSDPALVARLTSRQCDQPSLDY